MTSSYNMAAARQAPRPAALFASLLAGAFVASTGLSTSFVPSFSGPSGFDLNTRSDGHGANVVGSTGSTVLAFQLLMRDPGSGNNGNPGNSNTNSNRSRHQMVTRSQTREQQLRESEELAQPEEEHKEEHQEEHKEEHQEGHQEHPSQEREEQEASGPPEVIEAGIAVSQPVSQSISESQSSSESSSESQSSSETSGSEENDQPGDQQGEENNQPGDQLPEENDQPGDQVLLAEENIDPQPGEVIRVLYYRELNIDQNTNQRGDPGPEPEPRFAVGMEVEYRVPEWRPRSYWGPPRDYWLGTEILELRNARMVASGEPVREYRLSVRPHTWTRRVAENGDVNLRRIAPGAIVRRRAVQRGDVNFRRVAQNAPAGNEQPAEENNIHQPAEENNINQPAEENNINQPAEENNINQPAVQNQAEDQVAVWSPENNQRELETDCPICMEGLRNEPAVSLPRRGQVCINVIILLFGIDQWYDFNTTINYSTYYIGTYYITYYIIYYFAV
jgi:hypothetical protein